MIENTFGIDIIPENDVERINALRRYRVMDTPSEDSFDQFARLATRIFKVPIALVSLVDAERVFFKANVGMGKAKESNRGKSLCALAVLTPEVTVFEDALKEPCLLANPNVTGDFGLRFYAGAPLITHDGFMIGTFCIIDQHTRVFTKEEEVILKGLAGAVMDHIELRLSALNEIDKQQQINEDLLDQREETTVINEELRSANVELQQSQDHLQKKNEELLESEDRFRDLIHQVPVAVAIYRGPQMIIEQANEAMLAVWGITTYIIGQPLLTARPELNGHAYINIIAEVMETGQIHSGQAVKGPVTINGKIEDGYFNVTYKPVKADRNGVPGVIVVAGDVTASTLARKTELEMNEEIAAINEELTASNEELNESQLHLIALNENLKNSEARFRLLVEQSPVAMGKLKTRELIIDIANDEVLKIWGKDRSVLGKPLQQAIPELEGQPFLRILDDVFTSGRAFIGQELKATLTDNGQEKECFLNFVYQPIKGDDGLTQSILFIANDITEQVRARVQIEQSAKIDDQRKNDFIGMVSHELKTPLTSLKGFVQLLQIKAKKTDDAHTITVLEKAGNQVVKMTKMIDGFLNVSRFESGKMHLEHQRFDMKDLIREIEEETVPAHNSHHIIFEPVLTTWVNGDRDKLGQVITNLISNALKYSAAGTTVQIACLAAEGCSRVSVRDEGMGIAPKDIDKLFDRYYRVEGHQMKGIAGFGIGLFLCAEIIERHNGKIGLESEVGKGSTFYFSIPVID
jgi:PAS domain S-box-containing protein